MAYRGDGAEHGPTGGGGGDEHQPQDEIDRRLRELTDEIVGTSRIHEPTAAQRAAAAKKAKAPKPKRPRKHSGRGGLIVTWTIVLAVLAGGGAITWFHFHSPGIAKSARSGATSVTSPSRPLVRPSTFISSGPPADPFTGTPANGWADGAAGIIVPEARPHGKFTAAQVQAAYQKTRRILIAGFLDWPTLRGDAPNAFASLLASQQRREFLAGLGNNGRDKHGFPLNTRNWVASFAPGRAKFITNVVKVHGSMTAGTAVVSGAIVLSVRVSYLFAYAVEPPGFPARWMRIVVHEYGQVDFAQWDDPDGPLEPAVQMTPASAGGMCGMTDGYIHPQYPQGPPPKIQASGPPVNPYSTAPLPSSDSYRCQATTGT